MGKVTVLILSLLIGSQAFAANISGAFNCSDSGTLEVSQDGIGVYQASLQYSDGSSSTLDKFIFKGESLRGQMLRDDEDANMGKVIIADQGQKLILYFDGGEVVTCEK